jgi:hypothetical protein
MPPARPTAQPLTGWYRCLWENDAPASPGHHTQLHLATERGGYLAVDRISPFAPHSAADLVSTIGASGVVSASPAGL